MAQAVRSEDSAAAGAPEANPRVLELERRIAEIEGLDDSAFGAFTRLDWLVCALAALIAPAALLFWFGR